MWCLLTISFRWAGFYLERSRQSAAKENPAFKKCKRSQQGNLTACFRHCSGVRVCGCVCFLECFCVTSQSSLLKHKGPAALSCWGQVLWRADFGFTVAVFSLRAAEFYLQIRQCSAQPLCQLAFSSLFFVRERKLIWTLSSFSSLGPSIRLSGGLSV